MYMAYYAATLVAAFLFALSGVAKLSDLSQGQLKEGDSDKLRLLELSRSPLFLIVEYSVAILLPSLSEGAVKTSVLFLLALISLIGLVFHLRTRNTECRCFGALTPKNTGALLAIHFLLTLLLATLVWISLFPAAAEIGPFVRASSSLVVAIFAAVAGLYGQKRRSVATSPISMHASTAAPEQMPSIPVDFQLGIDSLSETVQLGRLVKDQRPMFIVGIHAACQECKKLAPDIVGFAKGFGDQFPIVVIANVAGHAPTTDSRLISLMDMDERLAKLLKVDARPFAVLINGSTLRLMAPPSMGANAVRSLFAITLNTRISPKVYSTRRLHAFSSGPI